MIDLIPPASGQEAGREIVATLPHGHGVARPDVDLTPRLSLDIPATCNPEQPDAVLIASGPHFRRDGERPCRTGL